MWMEVHRRFDLNESISRSKRNSVSLSATTKLIHKAFPCGVARALTNKSFTLSSRITMVHHSNENRSHVSNDLERNTARPTSQSIDETGSQALDEGVQSLDDEGSSNLLANVWRHAKKKNKDEAICNHCDKLIKTTNGGTSTLRRHLITLHGLSFLNQPTSTSGFRSRKGRIGEERKKRLDKLAIHAIIEDGRTFNDLRTSGMSKFLSEAVPGKDLSFVKRRWKKQNSIQSLESILNPASIQGRSYCWGTRDIGTIAEE